ncbi:uncharacterized protein LOC105380538 isoform X3 [Plutella xylostella]|uniref:uncharacterized protein LOC105380538 isoform X3 n=1 Tax=Plutella xylostella TaxID=51655 RepID=UPI002032A479|nr:uncharacterized protein LOC105380538 isoform X3 [Plutella xylostella]
MTKNNLLIIAGIATLLQGAVQLLASAWALAEYFCVFNLLRDLPILIYLRILYFHNPTCSTRVTIGPYIDGMSNQAFVLLTSQSVPVYRTFLVNSVYLGLSVVWMATSAVLILGGARDSRSLHVRWPWMVVMVVTFAVDICASVTYITDSFHTRTLAELVHFVGGTLSGAAGVTADSSWTAWVMVMVYCRLIVVLLFNLFLLVCILVDCGIPAHFDWNQTLPPPSSSKRRGDPENPEDPEEPETRIPRVSILRRVPTWLGRSPPAREPPRFYRRPSTPDMMDSPDRTPPLSVPGTPELPKKRSVNFPENLLSLPQRLENMIVQQQKRLDSAVVDTSGRSATPSPQDMPTIHQALNSATATSTAVVTAPGTASSHVDSKGRRNTAIELQGQLPWTYIPPTTHHMRDQLPPDEELPPVPVPDYTLHPKYRKASVHRAGSTVSQGPRPQNYYRPSHRSQQIMESDVLY